jgi:hypothetical protein
MGNVSHLRLAVSAADGRACFDIYRAPLGVLEDSNELYHARKVRSSFTMRLSWMQPVFGLGIRAP